MTARNSHDTSPTTISSDARSQLTSDLIRDEGEVLHAYPDSRGFLTIGVGQLIDPLHGGSISRAASRFMLDEKINECVDNLTHALPTWTRLTPARQLVLLNMIYSLGYTGFLNFRRLLGAIRLEKFDVAASEILNSDAAKQLPARYARLAEAMRNG